MHAILFAYPGLAALVERQEFHFPACQVGVGLARDLEAEAGPAKPCDAALPFGRWASPLAGFRVVAFFEDIADGSANAFADIDARRHGGMIAPCRSSSSVPSAGSRPSGQAVPGMSGGIGGKSSVKVSGHSASAVAGV